MLVHPPSKVRNGTVLFSVPNLLFFRKILFSAPAAAGTGSPIIGTIVYREQNSEEPTNSSFIFLENQLFSNIHRLDYKSRDLE